MNKYTPLIILIVVVLIVSSSGCVSNQQIQKQTGNSVKNNITNTRITNEQKTSTNSEVVTSNTISTKLNNYIKFSISDENTEYKIKSVYLSQPPRKLKDIFPFLETMNDDYVGVIIVEISGKYPKHITYTITNTPENSFSQNSFINGDESIPETGGSNDFILSIPINGRIGETKYVNIWVKKNDNIIKIGHIQYKIVRFLEPLNTGISINYENTNNGQKVIIKSDTTNYVSINSFLRENFNVEIYQVNKETGTIDKVLNEIPTLPIYYVVFSNLSDDQVRNEVNKLLTNETYTSNKVIMNVYTNWDTSFSVGKLFILGKLFNVTPSGTSDEPFEVESQIYTFLQYIPLLRQYKSMYVVFPIVNNINIYYVIKMTPKSDVNDILKQLWTTPISFSNKPIIIIKTPKSTTNSVFSKGLTKVQSEIEPLFTHIDTDNSEYLSFIMSTNTVSITINNNMKVFVIPPLINRQLYELPLEGLILNGIPSV